MHDSSIFKIRIDFEKSKYSYIYDKNTGGSFLDFFGLYSSLPLGYNHEIFSDSGFVSEIKRISGIKVPNCEVISDEAQEFLKEFSGHRAMAGYKYFHFACTGALAIEAAIKITIDQKQARKPIVLSLKESFHGINSFGNFVTDRFVPVNARLDGLPGEIGWRKLHSPKILYGEANPQRLAKKQMEHFIFEFEKAIKEFGADNIAGLLIEPIQATYGDNYFSQEFFQYIRQMCDRFRIGLIFDEIQTGFGPTGKMWYYEHLGIEPDVVAFGKKAQTSGVMAKAAFGKTFEKPVRLEVTWDGELVDMVRSKYVLRAYQKYGILRNVNDRSAQLLAGLKDIEAFKNLRSTGLLVAFDFDTEQLRDSFFKQMVEKRFMCNKTRDKTIRLRPNLNVSSTEIEEALKIMKSAVLEGAYAQTK